MKKHKYTTVPTADEIIAELLSIDRNDPELKRQAEKMVSDPDFGTYTESLVVATQHLPDFEDWGVK